MYGCTQKLHDAWKQAHKNLFWNVDTLQQPKDNDGVGCKYKFKEAGKPIGRESSTEPGVLIFFYFDSAVQMFSAFQSQISSSSCCNRAAVNYTRQYSRLSWSPPSVSNISFSTEAEIESMHLIMSAEPMRVAGLSQTFVIVI